MILTDRGDVAVETLTIGDNVITTTGETRPVRWIGRRVVSTRFADPLRVNPVHIKTNALADGVPSRDLLISPDHALLVDGILAQAGALVNGISIVRETEVPESFTYYHVEVADHSLILAEDTPAETFIDNVDRMAFDNWEEYVAVVGETSITEMELPRAKALCGAERTAA
ncbi:MAG: Hint domain-containing protein [Acidocella sp.]|uniref:Hint domain-containing protein n=1 Tax=Acidocella sp. TaxID=50710 RepID=UPI003FD827E2